MKYSVQENNFIKENAPSYHLDELTNLFNATFNRSVTKIAVKQRCAYLGTTYLSSAYHLYNKEELEWLTDQYLNTLTPADILADEFNKKFQPKDKLLSGPAIIKYMNNHNIHRGKNIGQFGQGKIRIPFPSNTFLADVKIGGRTYKRIKTPTSSQFYHRYLYEKHNGALRKGDKIIFLDGDTTNLDINNLEKIDNQIAGSMMCYKTYGLNKISEASIECIKLERIIKKWTI